MNIEHALEPYTITLIHFLNISYTTNFENLKQVFLSITLQNTRIIIVSQANTVFLNFSVVFQIIKL